MERLKKLLEDGNSDKLTKLLDELAQEEFSLDYDDLSPDRQEVINRKIKYSVKT